MTLTLTTNSVKGWTREAVYERVRKFYNLTMQFPEVTGGQQWGRRTLETAEKLRVVLPPYACVHETFGGIKPLQSEILKEAVVQPRPSDEEEATDPKRGARRKSAVTDAEILAAYDSGMVIGTVARVLGVHHTTVRSALRRRGEEVSRRAAYVVTAPEPTVEPVVAEPVAVEVELVPDGEMPGHLLREEDIALPEPPAAVPMLASGHVSVDRQELAELVALAERAVELETTYAKLQADYQQLIGETQITAARLEQAAKDMRKVVAENEQLKNKLTAVELENAQYLNIAEDLKHLADNIPTFK